MDVRVRDRFQGRLLIGLALVALVAGAGWWQTSDPGLRAVAAPAAQPTAVPGSGAASGDLAAQAPLRRALAGSGPATPDGPATPVVIDVETGQVLGYPTEPGDRIVLRVPDGQRVPAGLSSFWADSLASLAEPSGRVWREQLTLTADDEPLSRRLATQRGGQYRLQYACLGSGTLFIEVRGSRSREPAQPRPCVSAISTVDLVTTGSLRIRGTRVSGGPVVFAAQLVTR